jgi:2-keto-4-pentenoate hydratase/2-oxohepta-3-ene-1,7-dioic acid hydratase in catechol pathway
MKIICIGRNYVAHANELNNPVPTQPVFFMKPDTALLPPHNPFFYPNFSKDIHYEVELVIKINKNGRHIAEKFAHKYYDEISVGIDFTARDLQARCKEKGLPWEIAKAFDGSAPVSNFISVNTLADPKNIKFQLHKNGELVQDGQSELMIFSFESVISYVSKFITLKMGDLIFTGTPAGVGPVKVGDKLEASIEGKKLLKCQIK